MQKYDAVIFDLDGTLIDSQQGIKNCIIYALKKMGKPIPDEEILRYFFGPPLYDSFARYCGMNNEEAAEAVRLYREKYVPEGWKESRIYPGIRALLKELKKQETTVLIATGKPRISTEKILDHLRLRQFIDGIASPDESDPRAEKKLLIDRLIKTYNTRRPVMIGDRITDIIGAAETGIDAIGVLYGYGDEKEFSDAYCPKAETPEELAKLILGYSLQQKGYFISFEGLDGCGKTTQADAIESKLIDLGYKICRTREPGGCPISEKIRDLLLDINNTGMTDITEALLYSASRAQHVREKIAPALAEGHIVICDRFVDSSVAFQGGGRELGVELIQQINAPAVDGCMPDTTVLLKLDHITALSRREKASVLDRIESEKAAFHHRVEKAYQEIAEHDPERFIIVDARMAQESITKEIFNELVSRLEAAEVF